MEQREIKFRAWNGEYFCPIEDDGDGLRLWDKWGECKNVVLLQYTGLKDSKGVEIYEQDIVRIHDAEEDDGMGENYKNRLVEFENGGFVVHYNFGEYDVTTIGWAIDQWEEGGITCEVVGNKFQHPELLKQ